MNDRERYAMDMLTCAIEGGINYWAIGRKFVTGDNDFYESCELKPDPAAGEAFPDGDHRNKWQSVNVETLLAACDLILSDAGAKLCRQDIRADILADISDHDLCRSDAETADVIVQIAMFGEIVFG